MRNLTLYILCFILFINFSPLSYGRDESSAKPRMIEVEEEVWIENNEKIRLLKDELLRVAAELRISQEEIKRLKRELVQIKKGGGEEEAETYRVREGESLWKIAKKFYDDAYKWLWIFKANIEQINDPDNIYPDQVLDIPRY